MGVPRRLGSLTSFQDLRTRYVHRTPYPSFLPPSNSSGTTTTTPPSLLQSPTGTRLLHQFCFPRKCILDTPHARAPSTSVSYSSPPDSRVPRRAVGILPNVTSKGPPVVSTSVDHPNFPTPVPTPSPSPCLYVCPHVLAGVVEL